MSGLAQGSEGIRLARQRLRWRTGESLISASRINAACAREAGTFSYRLNSELTTCAREPVIHSSADISSVANLNNVDNSRLIIDGVNDPIVALMDTKRVGSTREVFRP